MSWTSIDRELCNQCGICVLRCPRNYRDVEGTITANATEGACNRCGHCVALCPAGAITHHRMDMDNFSELGRQPSYDPDEFLRFIRSRRSHRAYKDREVPREVLNKLVEVCRYTPTGSNRQTVEIAVIQDPERRKRLSDHAVDFFDKHTDRLIEEAREYQAAGLEVPQLTRSSLAMANTLKLVVIARKIGMDPIFYNAPVIMAFHTTTDASCPKDDCVIASTTVTLAARTLSLETCYIGLFDFVANRYQPIIEELNLPENHKVLSTLILGYPKFKYLRAVDRDPMRVQWL